MIDSALKDTGCQSIFVIPFVYNARRTQGRQPEDAAHSISASGTRLQAVIFRVTRHETRITAFIQVSFRESRSTAAAAGRHPGFSCFDLRTAGPG